MAVVSSFWLGREDRFGLAQPEEVIFSAELRGVWGGDLAPVLDGRYNGRSHWAATPELRGGGGPPREPAGGRGREHSEGTGHAQRQGCAGPSVSGPVCARSPGGQSGPQN
jgi:hypothetical protein